MRHQRTALPKQPARASLWWRAGLIIAAGLLAYSNSLSGPFVLDDSDTVVRNPAIREWWNLARVLAQHRDTPLAGRPVVGLSFALNYAAHGLAVQGYHAVNIAIHVICALLLFGIIRRTLSSTDLAPRFAGAANSLAFATAMIWVLHPLNSEAVDYLTERTESMMAMFLLLTLYASIRSADVRLKADTTRLRTAAWQTLAVCACGLGMLSKESMVVAPLLVVFYDRIFLFSSLRTAFRAQRRFYGGLAATWLLLAAMMLPGPRSSSVGLTVTLGMPVPIGPWTYLLNQTEMILRYLRLAFWPSDLVVAYGAARPLHLANVWPQGLLVMALLIATVAALRVWPKVGFLAAWVFITLAPTSSIIPIATEVGAERRMYLPLMALAALVVVGAYSLDLLRRRVTPVGAAATLATALLLLGSATFLRNRDFGSGLLLAQSVLARRAIDYSHALVGVELAALHRDDEAARELRLAIDTYPESRYNLGIVLYNLKRYDEAIHELRTYVSENPLLEHVPSAERIIGQMFVIQRRWQDAIDAFERVLSMAPSDPETKRLLVDVLYNQGVEMAGAGRFSEAASSFRKAVKLDPGHGRARHNLAAALLDTNDPAGAEAEARKAIEINPMDAGSYDLLGRALALQGKVGEAVAQLEQAARLAPADTQVRDDLRKVRSVQH